MKSHFFKNISVCLVLILFISVLLPVIYNPAQNSSQVRAIGQEELFLGLGVAVFIYATYSLSERTSFEVSDPVIDFDDEQKDLLVRIISAEARGESMEGQIAVGAVVLNRMESPDFPDNLQDVIYQKDQFSPVEDGSLYLTPHVRAKEAAQKALAGEDPTGGALYFYNPDKAKNGEWFEQNTTPLKKIGNHVFSR